MALPVPAVGKHLDVQTPKEPASDVANPILGRYKYVHFAVISLFSAPDTAVHMMVLYAPLSSGSRPFHISLVGSLACL